VMTVMRLLLLMTVVLTTSSSSLNDVESAGS
jgi:hypothetical protein